MEIDSFSDIVARRLSSTTCERLVTEDLDRIADGHYGPYILTGQLSDASLVIGGRSGLLPLLVAAGNPRQTVFVVEPDSRRRQSIADSARQMRHSNVRLLEGIDGDLAEVAVKHSALGLLVIDGGMFSRGLLTRLAPVQRVEYLAGDFTEMQANPLWLHRLSRRMANLFHWHNLSLDRAMAGSGSQGPDVSIAVPAYGIEAYLSSCMESLVNQTLESIEVVVIDDGSKDRSGQIADEWAKRDARVRVIHQANAGCAAARSSGLASATGVFFGLVDGDDWVDPPMFQALAESAVRFGSDIAQCGFRHYYDSDGSCWDEPEHFRFIQRIGDGNGLIANPRDLIPGRPTIWRRLYRHAFLVSNGIDFPHSIRRFDDLSFHFMTLALAERLSVVNACYYNYRQQRPGQDIGVNDERLHVHFDIFRLLKQFVRQHYSPELEEKLFMSQVASHEWASRVIVPRLLDEYRAKAKQDIFQDTIALNAATLIRSAWRHDRRKGYWALRLALG